MNKFLSSKIKKILVVFLLAFIISLPGLIIVTSTAQAIELELGVPIPGPGMERKVLVTPSLLAEYIATAFKFGAIISGIIKKFKKLIPLPELRPIRYY